MTTVRKRAFAASLAVATTITLAGCGNDSAGPEIGTDVEDVAEAEPDEPDEDAPDLLGETVTVSGEITEVIDPGAFWLGAGGGLFEEGAPVVSAAGDFTAMDVDPAGLLDSDTILQVTGTVAEFVLLDFEEEYGIDLDDDLYEDLEGEAVIVADDIATLAGEDVTIAGEVFEVMSTVSFRLVGAGWSVVVLDAEQAAVEPGDSVEVQGTVRQLDVAELEEDYDLDLEDELYTPLEGELVLVADAVTPAE